MIAIGGSLKVGLKPRIIAPSFIHRQPENMIRSMMMRTQFCLAAMLLSALLLGGCATGMMHDKINDLPEQKAMYSQETLRYMGLDKDSQLIMLTDKHHFVLSAHPSEQPYQAKIFAKLNRWAQQYLEAAPKISPIQLQKDGSAKTEISWQIENSAVIKDIASEYDCPCMRKYPQSSVLFIKLAYLGKSYTAQPNTDYRVNGMTAMNTPINVVQYRHSKSYAAAKAAAVLVTPFAAAVDVITLPIQSPVFIDSFSKVRH